MLRIENQCAAEEVQRPQRLEAIIYNYSTAFASNPGHSAVPLRLLEAYRSTCESHGSWLAGIVPPLTIAEDAVASQPINVRLIKAEA